MSEPYDIYEDREPIQFIDGGARKRTVRQHIVKEVPLTIMLNGEEFATLLCSPHSFELLALGFLVNEGVLQHRDELRDIAYRSDQGLVWAETTDGVARTDGFRNRNSSGYYGKGGPSLRTPVGAEQIQPVPQGTQFAARELLGFASLLEQKAHTFRLTGGVHEAALAHRDGFVVMYEDIGRHNALDRVLGYTFLNGINTSDKAVVLSGRIASEMLAKVARVGVPVVVSRSAPTCLSIAMAERLGITLVGFARGDVLSVYTHPGRVVE